MRVHFAKLLGYALLIFTLGYCQQASKEQALEASEEQPVQSITELATWHPIDTTMSITTWIGSKPTGQHNGIIPFQNGEIGVYQNEIVGGKFQINIRGLKVMDLQKDPEKNEKLHSHLMSEDFFAADSFPSASFEVTEVAPYDSAKLPQDTQSRFESEYAPETLSAFMVPDPTHLVTGNLSMRGVTKSITFPAKFVQLANLIRIEARFNLNRTDWNLSYSDEASVLDKARDKFIFNTVNVGLYVEAPVDLQ